MGRNVRRESEGGFGGSPTTCVGAVCGRMAAQVRFALSVALSETNAKLTVILESFLRYHWSFCQFLRQLGTRNFPDPLVDLAPSIKSSAKKSVQG